MNAFLSISFLKGGVFSNLQQKRNGPNSSEKDIKVLIPSQTFFSSTNIFWKENEKETSNLGIRVKKMKIEFKKITSRSDNYILVWSGEVPYLLVGASR